MKFYSDQTPDGKYMIFLDDLDFFQKNHIQYNSSYNVLQSRLLNLNYPEYLKYLCACGAELRNKQGYTYAVFEQKENCDRIVRILNMEFDKVKKFFST